MKKQVGSVPVYNPWAVAAFVFAVITILACCASVARGQEKTEGSDALVAGDTLVSAPAIPPALSLPPVGKLVISFANNDSSLSKLTTGQRDTLAAVVAQGLPTWLLPGHSSAPFRGLSHNASDRRNMLLATGRGRAIKALAPDAFELPPMQMGRVTKVYWGENPYAPTTVQSASAEAAAPATPIPTSLYLSPRGISLFVGQSLTVEPFLVYSTGMIPLKPTKVHFSVSNTTAHIDSTGRLQALEPDTVTVTASYVVEQLTDDETDGHEGNGHSAFSATAIFTILPIPETSKSPALVIVKERAQLFVGTHASINQYDERVYNGGSMQVVFPDGLTLLAASNWGHGRNFYTVAAGYQFPMLFRIAALSAVAGVRMHDTKASLTGRLDLRLPVSGRLSLRLYLGVESIKRKISPSFEYHQFRNEKGESVWGYEYNPGGEETEAKGYAGAGVDIQLGKNRKQ